MLSGFRSGMSMQDFQPFRPIHIITVTFVSQSESQAESPNRNIDVKSQTAIQANFSQSILRERAQGGGVQCGTP